jgi:hypothetical protein
VGHADLNKHHGGVIGVAQRNIGNPSIHQPVFVMRVTDGSIPRAEHIGERNRMHDITAKAGHLNHWRRCLSIAPCSDVAGDPVFGKPMQIGFAIRCTCIAAGMGRMPKEVSNDVAYDDPCPPWLRLHNPASPLPGTSRGARAC